MTGAGRPPRGRRGVLGVGLVLIVLVISGLPALPSARAASAPARLGLVRPAGSFGDAGRPGPSAPSVRMTTVALRPHPSGSTLSERNAWLAYDPDDADFWVADGVAAVDLVPADATGTVAAVLPVGSDPFGVAVDPSAGEVFVSNTGSDNVTVLSDRSNASLGSFPTGDAPMGIAVDPALSEVFVANSGSANLTVYSESTGAVVASVPVGLDPTGLALDPYSGKLFVADGGSFTVTVVDVATDEVVATEPAGLDPYGVALDPGSGNVYVTNSGSENLSVLNGSTGLPVTTISASTGLFFPQVRPGFELEGLAYDTATGEMWVGAGFADLLLVNTTSESVAAYLTIDPSGAAWDPTTGTMCVTDSYNATLACLTQTPTDQRAVRVYVNATGLPGAEDWSLWNGSAWSARGPSLSLELPSTLSAQYSYYVPPAEGYLATPSTITITMRPGGPEVTPNVTFARDGSLAPVRFHESGLPAGQGWSVDLDGWVETSTSGNLSFDLPNGSYDYAFTPIAGFVASDAPGRATVDGIALNLSVNFTPVRFPVTASESGLPAGTPWYLNGSLAPTGVPLNDSGPILSTNYSMDLPNGSYAFRVDVANSSFEGPAGTDFAVQDGAVVPASALEIAFGPYRSTLTFAETGLPAGTRWGITYRGSTVETTEAELGLPSVNGTANFTVDPPYGYAASPSSGEVTVGTGASPTVAIAFASDVEYPVEFEETGLANGTPWTVQVGSEGSVSGSNATLTIRVPNGSYSYAVSAVSGYQTPAIGAVSVTGSGAYVSIGFQVETYPVVVVVAGLPGGSTWTATFTNSSTGASFVQASVSSTVLAYLPDGAYNLSIAVPDGYSVASITPRTFVVRGPTWVSAAVTVVPTPSVPPSVAPAPVSPIPFATYVVAGIALLAVVLVLGLLARSRGRPPEGAVAWPTGPIPPDRSLGPNVEEEDRPRGRTNGRPEPGTVPAPLDDVF